MKPLFMGVSSLSWSTKTVLWPLLQKLFKKSGKALGKKFGHVWFHVEGVRVSGGSFHTKVGVFARCQNIDMGVPYK